jgi:hypothetical protein
VKQPDADCSDRTSDGPNRYLSHGQGAKCFQRDIA